MASSGFIREGLSEKCSASLESLEGRGGVWQEKGKVGWVFLLGPSVWTTTFLPQIWLDLGEWTSV